MEPESKFRTDLNAYQWAQLDRALLIIRMDDELRAENKGFCVGSADKARKLIQRYSVTH